MTAIITNSGTSFMYNVKSCIIYIYIYNLMFLCKRSFFFCFFNQILLDQVSLKHFYLLSQLFVMLWSRNLFKEVPTEEIQQLWHFLYFQALLKVFLGYNIESSEDRRFHLSLSLVKEFQLPITSDTDGATCIPSVSLVTKIL